MENNVDYTKKSPTILSLCSGYGGLEKGVEAVIGKCSGLAYVEIEAFAIANLVNKMETGEMDPVPIWTDIKTFNARRFRGCVDILTGGYPCQPFSAAGKRNGTDDPRHLWPYIRTIVMDCKPRQCFFENVEGHLTLGISEVLSDLEAMGYKIAVGIFSAAEVGAPHQRKRLFILANSSDSRPRCDDRPPGSEAGAEILRQGDREERSIWPDSTGSVVADYMHGDSRGAAPNQNTSTLGRAIRNGQPAPENSSTNGKRLESWMTPDVSDRRSKNCKQSGLSNQTNPKGNPARLNPNWVEQLMGLPIGWTALDYSEME